MKKFKKSLKYWGSEKFISAFKMELADLGVNNFPLKNITTPGKFITDSDIGITILTTSENKKNIRVKTGVIFSEVQWGYCCGEEEPMVSHGYCEMVVIISKNTADVEFSVC